MRTDKYYYRLDRDEPPQRVAGTKVHWDKFSEGDIEPSPDGTVYGHTLEPGGGPVDVSEWFPGGGRTCGNCAEQYAGMFCHVNKDAANRCDGKRSWKPREANNAPAIPPGPDEGGRTMSEMQKTETFDVVLTQEPTPEEARERGKIGVKVFDERITARSRDGALVKAAFKLAGQSRKALEGSKTASTDALNLDMIAPTVVPFGRS
jgi:hypothetical protein